MLFKDFKEWKVRNDYSLFTDEEHDRELFDKFLHHHLYTSSLAQVVTDLAWQVYYLQCCMEGLLEDA
jgi:hypothetical protein